MRARALRVPLLAMSITLVNVPAGAAEREAAVLVSDEHPRPSSVLPEWCGTALTPQEVEIHRARAEEGIGPAASGGGGPYYIPIAAHIVRQSDGSGGLPEARYQQAIADANGHYAPANMIFYTLGEIDYIDSDDFYTTSTLDEIDDLRTTNTVPNAINIYFTENLNYEQGGLCGISAFTTSSTQAIAMRNSCTALDTGFGNHSTFSHEIGHYFDLFHTHEPFFGDELVDGSNCDVAGDLLCDTPADPRLTSGTVSDGCVYTGNATDGNGDPYAPDVSLLMSYSKKHCRSVFTADSYDKMVATLVNERPELLSNPVSASDLRRPASRVTLSPPRPNPARALSELSFTVKRAGFLEVAIFDVAGRLVRTIARAPYSEGTYTVGWDGRDELGSAVAPGTYFARLVSDGNTQTRKIQRLR